MTLLPIVSSLYFLERSLDTSLNLGFNTSVTHALEFSSKNLKELKKYDPQNEEKYRQQFEEIKDLTDIYSNPEQIKKAILDSLKIYFIIGLALSVLFPLVVALFLNHKVAQIYQATFDDLAKQKEQVHYLKEISAWQQMAQMLVHEIRNPLTPIELVTTSLKNSFDKVTALEFKEILRTTEKIILEELGHLRKIVHRFGEFAKVPKVHLQDENAERLFQKAISSLSHQFPDADIHFASLDNGDFSIQADESLIRQVLSNLIRNGLEANPGIQKLRFDFAMQTIESELHVSIRNHGAPIPNELVDRIFEPSFSTHPTKENMGLGLAIVRKIMIEHHGDISYREENHQPVFVITLPLIGDHE
jgi:signal transduction histidine kinase